jgi:hypothetical protein
MMYETEAELAELQRLLDASFNRAGENILSIFNTGNRLSARQLSGFQGVRQVAVATVNSDGEPRAAPRNACFLHGKFGDVDLFIRVDGANMLAFAKYPERFPEAWADANELRSSS